MIIDQIGAHLAEFSPTNNKIATYVLKNKENIGFSSVQDLSDTIGVSKASIVRFARAIGYPGFNEMKKDVQKELKKQLSPYSNILFNDLDLLSEEEKLNKLIQNEVSNLNRTLDNIDVMVVHELLKLMDGAGKIFVAGFGGSGPVAHKFYHSLRIISNNRIELITGALSDFSPSLSSLEEDDLIFILTLPEYSREVFYLAEYVAEKKGKMCLMTDAATCPLYDKADITLFCDSNSLTLANSYVGLAALHQIVTNMYFLFSKDKGIKSVQNVRDIEHHGKQYYKKQGSTGKE